MSRKVGTRTKEYQRRRVKNSRKERFAHFVRRFGVGLSFFVIFGWCGAWFFLSKSDEKVINWAQQTFLEKTDEAGFTVKNILIEGRYHTDADLLLALINMEKGDPLLSFNPEVARKKIEEISWVKTAHTARRLPDTIYVGLEERVPYALWQHQGQVAVIDREGEILSQEMKPEFKDLFLVTGSDANTTAAEVIDLLQVEVSLIDDISAAMRVGERRWDLKLENGMILKLPEQDIGLALRRIADEQEQNDIFAKDLRVIDLREPGRMIVQTR